MSGYSQKLACSQPERKRIRSDDEIDEEEELQSFLARSSLKESHGEHENNYEHLSFKPPTPFPPREIHPTINEQLEMVRSLHRQRFLNKKFAEKRHTLRHRRETSPKSVQENGINSPEQFDETSLHGKFLMEDQLKRNIALNSTHMENKQRRLLNKEEDSKAGL